MLLGVRAEEVVGYVHSGLPCGELMLMLPDALTVAGYGAGINPNSYPAGLVFACLP